ncbi:hypothetical protein D3C85_1117290 [compost metagenome]
MRGAGAHFAAIRHLEAAIGLRLAQAQQTLAGSIFAGQQGGAGAGAGVRVTVGQLGDAGGATARAALVQQGDFRLDGGIEDAGAGVDVETAADAIGEIYGDLVHLVVHERWLQSGIIGRHPTPAGFVARTAVCKHPEARS